jgi:formylglycine-generating enzyme required for sulfatase activity
MPNGQGWIRVALGLILALAETLHGDAQTVLPPKAKPTTRPAEHSLFVGGVDPPRGSPPAKQRVATSSPAAAGTLPKNSASSRNVADSVSSTPALVNSLGMRFRRISYGTYSMGSPIWCELADRDELIHEVRLTMPFYLGVYEVTQGQFAEVMQTNPSHFHRTARGAAAYEHPVEQVTWCEAVEFCRRLSSLTRERRAGRVYRLPTEAEWEFACRSGSADTFHFGEDEAALATHAWFVGNTENGTQTVGLKASNAFGLYDMYGNVWEWCADWYGEYEGRELVSQDPRGPDWGDYRVVRGGSWRSPLENCRSADRGCEAPGRRCNRVGFRVLLMVGMVAESEASRLLTQQRNLSPENLNKQVGSHEELSSRFLASSRFLWSDPRGTGRLDWLP